MTYTDEWDKVKIVLVVLVIVLLASNINLYIKNQEGKKISTLPPIVAKTLYEDLIIQKAIFKSKTDNSINVFLDSTKQTILYNSKTLYYIQTVMSEEKFQQMVNSYNEEIINLSSEDQGKIDPPLKYIITQVEDISKLKLNPEDILLLSIEDNIISRIIKED